MTYDEIRKKHTVGNDARVQSSKNSNNTFYEIRSKHRLGDEVDEDYINNYIRDFNSFSTNSKSDFDSMNYKNASSVYNKYRQAGNDLDYRATNIKGYLKANKDSIDPDTYQNLVNYLDESRNAISSTNRYFEKNNDFYSQWDTEEDYNKYIQGVEEREGMLTYDLEAGKNDINSLESQLDKLKKEKSAYDNEYKKNGGYIPSTSNSIRPSYAQVEPYKEWSAQSAAYQKKIDALEKELAKQKIYYNRAERTQTADNLYNTALGSEDFGTISLKGKDNKIAQKRDEYETKYGESFGDDYEFGEATLSLEDRFAKYATDEEMNIYSYYLGKGDETSAQAFLVSMEETINARKGLGMYESVEDNTALELAFGAAAGIQQFGVGIGNLFIDKDYYAPTATQMASSAVREDLGDVGPELPEFMGGSSLGQVGYDIINTTANMMPSILASSLVTYGTGGIATPAVASALGGAVGSVSLGASSAGNAYAEMINLGYDKGQARTYAALVGGSEAGLQYLFGGIGKLGGKLTGKSVGAVVNNIDNAFARTAIKFGGNMVSEGFEEYAQEILDPFFKNIAFNESNEINLFTPEALYSGVLGALSAGFLEGVPGAVNAGTNALKTLQTGKALTKNKDFDVSRLVELGHTLSAGSVAYKIADKINENTGAYTIGKLFHSIGAELSAQNKADIVKSLTRKGVAESNANTIAEWLSAVVDGAKLTKTQIKALELNEDIANTFRDVVINKNSTFNQRRQAFFEAGGVDGYTGINTKALSEFNNPDAIAGRMEAGLADSQGIIGSRATPNLSDFESQLSQFAHETANGDVPAIANDGPFIPTAKQPFVPARTVEKIKSIEGTKAKEHEVSSTEGKTILLETDEVVSIKRIASTEGKSMKLELSDGRIVSSKDVGYASQGEALVYETVANMDVPVDVANSLVSMYDPTSGQSAVVFAKGIEEAYKYGYFSIPKAEMSARASFTSELTEKQRNDAYKLGSIMGAERAKNSPKTAGKRGAVGKGKVHFDGDRKDLKPQQKAALDALEVIAEVTDMQIEVFESPVVNGRRVGENGSYDPKTGIMRIDLHAGISGNGLMLFTAAHEIGHHIKNWSPAKFKVLADFLMEQYAEKGVSVDELVKRQIAKAKANGRTLSYEEAYEEFVCDSLETMLADGAVIEKLKLLATKDKSLVQKMKSFLKDLVAKIKKAYAGLKPDSAEGKLVAEMVDATERLQNLFIEALMDATENYQSAGMQKLNDFTEAKTADGGNLLMQYRAIVADTDTYKQMLTEHNIMTSSEIDRLFDTVDKAVGIVKSNLEALDYAWDVWSDTEDIRAFKPVKNNSDKLYKYSLDFSTLCRKRILQGIIATQLQDALNRPLSKEESVAIRNELVEIQKEMKQIEVACALCYVESARMKAPKQIEAFLKDVEGNLRSFFAGMDKATTQSKIKQAEADARAKLHNEHPNGVTAKSGIVRKFNEEKFPLSHMPKQYAVYIRDAKRAVKDAYKPTKEELHLINVAKNMRVTDFTSTEGLENLAVNYPRIYDAYTSFIRNATHSKGIENDTWFRAGDTKDVPQTLIDAMNAENGFRTQSWSDFQVKHLLDYISAVIELSSRKAKMQTYTKVPDFVHLMGKTGMMINLSLIPQAKFNGSLEYDSVEGIDYETALKLRELYPETAGTICIGIKNEQIIKLLASEMIDYVIPYHHSGMSKAFRKVMKIPTWDSFEAYQNESKISDISEAKAQAEKMEVKLISKSDSQWQKSPSFSEWFDLEEAKQIAEMENATPSNMVEKEQYGVMYGAYKAMQNAANNYLKLCAERGLKPKFSAENADFTAEPNYWKLLIDRKMVNNKTGEIIEQKAVKPVFDQNEVLRILNEEVARYGDVKEQMNKATNLVVKKFLGGEMNEAIQAINKATGNTAKVSILNTDTSNLGGIKRSDRDSEGRELSSGQQEFFKDSKVRDEKGNLKVVYHGTPDGDFNTFKLPEFFSTMMAAQGAGYYFTDKANATQYTKALAGKKAGKAKLFETYLNIKNPLIISDGSGVITKQQIIDIISKGNREWFFSSWINTALTTGTPETRLSKNEVASLSMSEKIDRYAEKISKYQDQDILAEMTRAFKGEAIIEAMESTFGTDGVKYTDRFGEIWVAWHPEQIKETTNKNPTSNLDVRYSFRGENKYGIEVYETSEEIKKLSIKERKKAFLDIMRNEYRGRTAKFIRNGHAYYASFDYTDINKNIYGDKHSDKKGWKAKINVGAEGDIFELVENAKYNGSNRESGKGIASHRGVEHWDYFIKTVQIDGLVFDLIANVRKKTNEQFVYSIQLNENKKIEASPSLGSPNGVLNRMLNASKDSISDSNAKSQEKLSERVIPTGIEIPEGTSVDKNGKPRTAQAQRDAGYMLSESKFLQLYCVHKLDIGKRWGDVDKQIESIKKDGFKGGSGTINIVPSSLMMGLKFRGVSNFEALLEMEKEGKLPEGYAENYKKELGDEYGKPIFSNIVQYEFAPRKGDKLLFVPKNQTKLNMVKQGFVPLEYEVVTVDYDLQPYYEMYTKAYNQAYDKLLGIRYSDRDPESTSPRNLLANALEGTVSNDVERKKLAEYKNKIDLMNAEEEKLTELRKQIKEASFSKGKRDSAKLKQLKEDATKTANRINTYDRQLLNLESTTALKNVLEREKKKATERQKQKDKEILAEYRKRAEQKQQDIIDRYQESRKKATEGRHKTEMRNKIKKVVSELNQYLLHGTKDKHVMIGMQKAVAEALSIVNMDTVGADNRVARYDALIAEATDPDVIESLTASRDRIKGQGDRLSEKLTSLQTAYSNIKDSSDPLVSNAYDEVIEAKIASVTDTVGNTPLRDMSMSQLESVYDLYKMVLTNIRNANKLFKAEKQTTIEEIGINVDGEIKEVTKQKDRMLPIMDFARKMGYKELKPIYFFRMLGSKTMTSLYESVRDGQNTWYRDAFDAKTFRMKTEKEYGYKKWDFKKKHSFEAKSGKTFDLTLSQIMSIYAFSRREQALDHLIKGGIVYDDAVKVKEKKKGIPISYMVNTSDAFNLSEVTLGEIIDTLSPEQKAFVETMQAYLSDTMGEKGNEVSLELYGVKMFKEKNYFPLKSSQYYMAFTAEEAGEVKIKNSSFSKETVKHANNPIVLSDFMDVWTSHVNDMAMYHAFVLPLEDFTRVYNYRTPTGDNFETTSIKSTIHNHFTESANEYIRQLLKDINGGSVSGVGTQLIDKMIGLAKKGAVFASASVVVQQPSAIARAMAYVNPKYFANFSAFNFAKHNRLWEECKRYAPIAGIKEMGYFDTSVGQTGIDWIKSDEYETRREKFFAFLKDGEQRGTILDDILSKAPAMADELSWVALWEAVKKETKKTTDLKVGSEEYFEHCGKRFTEVIDLTQVYDSVFSRSELMRSKDRMVKTATAFLSEPTTQVNMLFDAGLQLKRNGKKGVSFAVSVVGSVVASVVLNSLLKSFVLAGRDDDEDETFLEKYIASFTGDVLNGLNPLTLIPFVKDVISIVQGYSVDRMDMSIVDALVSSVLDFGKDTKTDYEKWTGLLGSVSQLFGVPVKNIIRDFNTAVNTFNTVTNGIEATKTGIKTSVEEGLSGTVTALLADKLAGVGFDTSKGKQYYDAVMSGDKAHASRIIAGYGDAKKADSAIVESLKNYEPRVVEAAQAQINGDNATRIRLAKEIIADGFKQDYVVKAINGMVNKLNKGEAEAYNPKAQSLYTQEDYFDAAYNGNATNAKTFKEEIIKTDMKNKRKTREEAEKSFNNSFRSSVKDAVLAGELTAEKASNMLSIFGGLDEESALQNAQYYEFKRKHPGVKYNWQSETVADYNEVAEPNGINVAVFDDYLVQKSECTGTDTNGDGKTDSGSKKAQVLIVIDSLPISSSQKDTLYRMNGWAESKLYEAPWH